VDMTSFVRNMDTLRQTTGAHLMVVHHTGKDAARGARGHNSLRAATDTEIEVQIDEDGTRSAMVTKQRDHAGGESYPC
jgi:RecA-family ATPase